MTRKTLTFCLLVIAAAAGNVFAVTQARITGKVIDAATKKPVPNVTITVVATEHRTFNQEYKGGSDGTYQIMLVDGTIRYKFSYSAPGYATYDEVMKLKIGGEPNEKNVELQMAAAVPAAGSRMAADASVSSYNEGAKLFNEGHVAESIVKFKEVVKQKPEMIAAWEALSRAYLRNKEYASAAEAAQKALDIAPDETDMYAIQYEAYTAAGDKAKAAEVKKKLPADAAMLFNDAVKLLNAGKDAEAEPLLRQSIQANDKFGPAYYELGMVCIRTGKMAEAKQLLQKYLEIDPDGKDAATAKESLKYLQ